MTDKLKWQYTPGAIISALLISILIAVVIVFDMWDKEMDGGRTCIRLGIFRMCSRNQKSNTKYPIIIGAVGLFLIGQAIGYSIWRNKHCTAPENKEWCNANPLIRVGKNK